MYKIVPFRGELARACLTLNHTRLPSLLDLSSQVEYILNHQVTKWFQVIPCTLVSGLVLGCLDFALGCEDLCFGGLDVHFRCELLLKRSTCRESLYLYLGVWIYVSRGIDFYRSLLSKVPFSTSKV